MSGLEQVPRSALGWLLWSLAEQAFPCIHLLMHPPLQVRPTLAVCGSGTCPPRAAHAIFSPYTLISFHKLHKSTGCLWVQDRVWRGKALRSDHRSCAPLGNPCFHRSCAPLGNPCFHGGFCDVRLMGWGGMHGTVVGTGGRARLSSSAPSSRAVCFGVCSAMLRLRVFFVGDALLCCTTDDSVSTLEEVDNANDEALPEPPVMMMMMHSAGTACTLVLPI